MFKYLRTLNSDNHPTEIFSLLSHTSEDDSESVKAGSIFSISYGKISEPLENAALYLALNSKSKDEEKVIKCIKLSTDMLLEGDIDTNTEGSSFDMGSVCNILIDMAEKGIKLTPADGGYGVFQVVSNENISNGKVIVSVL